LVLVLDNFIGNFMKKKNKKKVIVIIISVSLVIISSIVIFLLLKEDETVYPETPIMQETLYGYDESEIDMTRLPQENYRSHKIWRISNNVSLEAVERMALMISSDMLLTSGEGLYYHWNDSKGNLVTYFLSQNKVRFDLKEGIPWDETEIESHSFTKFVKNYFDKEWGYSDVVKKDLGGGMFIYYANRLTEDGVRIEMSSSFAETDHLILKDGNITSGDILLADFVDTEMSVPLIDTGELSKYINRSEYPKLVNISLYHLVPVFSEIVEDPNPYLNSIYREIMDGEKNCRALESQVVYYYTDFDHEFLTPVFKLDLECQHEYMNEDYYFIGTGYANAIDPSYVSIPE
jgi:hypothetical protein